MRDGPFKTVPSGLKGPDFKHPVVADIIHNPPLGRLLPVEMDRAAEAGLGLSAGPSGDGPANSPWDYAYFTSAAPAMSCISLLVSVVKGTTREAYLRCESRTFLKKGSFSSNLARTFFDDLMKASE